MAGLPHGKNALLSLFLIIPVKCTGKSIFKNPTILRKIYINIIYYNKMDKTNYQQRCSDYFGDEFNLGNFPICQGGWHPECGFDCQQKLCKKMGGTWNYDGVGNYKCDMTNHGKCLTKCSKWKNVDQICMGQLDSNTKAVFDPNSNIPIYYRNGERISPQPNCKIGWSCDKENVPTNCYGNKCDMNNCRPQCCELKGVYQPNSSCPDELPFLSVYDSNVCHRGAYQALKGDKTDCANWCYKTNKEECSVGESKSCGAIIKTSEKCKKTSHLKHMGQRNWNRDTCFSTEKQAKSTLAELEHKYGGGKDLRWDKKHGQVDCCGPYSKAHHMVGGVCRDSQCRIFPCATHACFGGDLGLRLP